MAGAGRAYFPLHLATFRFVLSIHAGLLEIPLGYFMNCFLLWVMSTWVKVMGLHGTVIFS